MVTLRGWESAKKRRRPQHIKEISSGPNGTLTQKFPVIVCLLTLYDIKMQQYTVVAVVFGVFAVFMISASSTAYVISCPPNNVQEASPNLRQLCYAIEQAVSDTGLPQDIGRLDERNVNMNAKRQDVDHVFLRFGRRFGL